MAMRRSIGAHHSSIEIAPVGHSRTALSTAARSPSGGVTIRTCSAPSSPIWNTSGAASTQSPWRSQMLKSTTTFMSSPSGFRRDELAATESLAGPCPASVVPLVSVSSLAVACFFPCLSCHPCPPCLLLVGHYYSWWRGTADRQWDVDRVQDARRGSRLNKTPLRALELRG